MVLLLREVVELRPGSEVVTLDELSRIGGL